MSFFCFLDFGPPSCYPGTVMAMGDIAERRHVCGKWAGRQAVTYHYSSTHSQWVTWGEWKVRRQESEKSKEEKTGVEQKIYSSPHTKTHTRPLATPSLGNLLFVFLLIRQTLEDKPSWQGFTVGLWKENTKWKDEKGEWSVKESWVKKTKIVST